MFQATTEFNCVILKGISIVIFTAYLSDKNRDLLETRLGFHKHIALSICQP